MEVKIPKLGVATTEALLTTWLVADGDEVAAGDPLYEVETDKVESEIESPSDGVVRILVEAGGEALPVGTLIAEIS